MQSGFKQAEAVHGASSVSESRRSPRLSTVRNTRWWFFMDNQHTSTASPGTRQAQGRAIDCDLHATVPSVDALLPYLPAYWQEQIRQSGFKGPIDTAYPASASTSARPDVSGHAGPVAEQLG